jgi:hypothetical protein
VGCGFRTSGCAWFTAFALYLLSCANGRWARALNEWKYRNEVEIILTAGVSTCSTFFQVPHHTAITRHEAVTMKGQTDGTLTSTARYQDPWDQVGFINIINILTYQHGPP